MSAPRLSNRKPANLRISLWLKIWYWWHKLTKKNLAIYPFVTINNGILTFNYCFQKTHDVQFFFPIGLEEAKIMVDDLRYFIELQEGLGR